MGSPAKVRTLRASSLLGAKDGTRRGVPPTPPPGSTGPSARSGAPSIVQRWTLSTSLLRVGHRPAAELEAPSFRLPSRIVYSTGWVGFGGPARALVLGSPLLEPRANTLRSTLVRTRPLGRRRVDAQPSRRPTRWRTSRWMRRPGGSGAPTPPTDPLVSIAAQLACLPPPRHSSPRADIAVAATYHAANCEQKDGRWAAGRCRGAAAALPRRDSRARSSPGRVGAHTPVEVHPSLADPVPHPPHDLHHDVVLPLHHHLVLHL